MAPFTSLVVDDLVLLKRLPLTLDGGIGHSHSVGSVMMEDVRLYVVPFWWSLRSSITMSQIRAFDTRKAQMVKFQPGDMMVYHFISC